MSQEDAENFERTLELGKQIAHDLSDSDILGRWMAHHISDLIVRAESAPEQQSHELRQQTTDTILRLWAQRATVPFEDSPTAALDAVAKAVQRLGDDKPWSFYNMFNRGDQPDSDDMATVTMLKIALELEETVRDVVQHLVVLAAKEAEGRQSKWLRLTEHLAEDDERELLRRLRSLEIRQRVQIAATANQPTQHPRPADVSMKSHSITVMRAAEKRIADIRRILEGLPSDVGAESSSQEH